MSQGPKTPRMLIHAAIALVTAGMGSMPVQVRAGSGFRLKRPNETPAKLASDIMAFQRAQKARRKARGC